jgi:CheY-like chemotaxis protein
MTRIVLIDDEESLRGALRRFLERLGYEVAEASDGSAGLKLLREQPAQLAITDIFMQGQGGLGTIREIRQEFPSLKIIAMSGGSSGPEDPLAVAKDMGANHVLSKPFDLATLGKVVAELLKQ